MKCLYVGYDFKEGKVGGDVVRWNINKLLKTMNNITFDDFLITKNTQYSSFISDILRFSFNGGSVESIKAFKRKLSLNTYDYVFFDGSLFGVLIKHTKKIYPHIKIVTLFHNVELQYYLDRIKVKGLSNSVILPSVYYNERLSYKYSDEIVTFTERDKVYLYKLYRKINEIHVIPIYIEDSYDQSSNIINVNYDYLFIGSAFYANQFGIEWFIENVLPNLEGKLLVVGKGMEYLKNRQLKNTKLIILGTVDSINEFYYEDNIIISPIFHGSGMKTKTVEALMFNKKIVGTPEAFVGIPVDEKYMCNTADDFINVLSNVNSLNFEGRKIYQDYLALDSIRGKYEKIFFR